MKVLNLRCAHGHLFEGWFASEADFLDQNGRGLIDCPMCADKLITRLPSAPRLNLSSVARLEGPLAQADPVPVTVSEPTVKLGDADRQALFLQAVQHVMTKTEDVGPRFPEEARRIHYGEAEARGIRGQATAHERAALADEGIEVMALPVPTGWKGSAH